MASEQNTRRPARPRQVTVIAATAVFVVGFLVGQVLRSNRGLHPDSQPSKPEPPTAADARAALDADPTKTEATPSGTPPINTEDAISRADSLLRDGQANDAATIYLDLLAGNPTKLKPHLLYRLALCREELGNLEQAWSEYQSLAGEDHNVGFWKAVQFAQARVALRMGKAESARWLLSRFSLNSGNDDAEDFLSADVAHLLGHLYAVEALRELPLDVADERALIRPQLTWSVDQALELIQQEVAGETGAGTPLEPGILIVDRFGGRPEQLRVNARLSGTNAFDAVAQLAASAGLEVHWTSAAEQFAHRHPARAAVRGISAARFLDLLLDQLSLYWIEDEGVDEGVIEIRSAGEISNEKLLSVQAEQASRNLRYAVSMYPESRLAPYSYLNLGSVAFATGGLQDSVTFFMELVRQHPSASVLRIAWFNLGKLYRLLDDPTQTESAFLHVVDESPGNVIEPLGYLYLGRHYLEQDNPLLAAKHLVRAVSLAKNSETRSQATLALAAAYLMAGNDAAANMVIMEQRETLQASAFRDAAVFLSALARTRASTDEGGARTHGRQLATSISRVKPTDFGGTVGHLLIGAAYEILGLRNQMAIVFENGIESAAGPLRDRMKFELAGYYFDQDAPDTARHHLESLRLEGTKGWDRRAKLQIAKMDTHAASPLSMPRALPRAVGIVHVRRRTIGHPAAARPFIPVAGGSLQRGGVLRGDVATWALTAGGPRCT